MSSQRDGALEGKVAVVTGVGSGLGKATLSRFAEAGASVVGADIDLPSGTKTVADLREAGLEATFKETDVTSEEQVKALIDHAVDRYGRLDLLHNNAGIMPVHPSIEETSFEMWKKVIAVDLDSVFLGCKYGVPAMKKSGGGRIMNTASLAGIRAFMWGIHYTAAKGGVVQMSIALAHLLEDDNIKVNSICPTGVATNLGRGFVNEGMRELMASKSKTKTYGPLDPKDIARAAYFLATKADFSGGAVICNATPDREPVYSVAFEYNWEPLDGV